MFNLKKYISICLCFHHKNQEVIFIINNGTCLLSFKLLHFIHKRKTEIFPEGGKYEIFLFCLWTQYLHLRKSGKIYDSNVVNMIYFSFFLK